MLTLQQIKKITNQKDNILIPFVAPLIETFEKFSILTPTIQSHFLAQICHESGCFRYTEEIASGDAYDTRVDLGNTPEKDGDGRLYKGRGLIQLTGKSNYKKLSNYFKVDFVKNPSLLKSPAWACKSAGWFWITKNLNELAIKNDFLRITYLINGGFNGLEDRLKYFKKSLLTFDLDLTTINVIFNQIEYNITTVKDTHFKKMLFKTVPNKESLSKLEQSLSLYK